MFLLPRARVIGGKWKSAGFIVQFLEGGTLLETRAIVCEHQVSSRQFAGPASTFRWSYPRQMLKQHRILMDGYRDGSIPSKALSWCRSIVPGAVSLLATREFDHHGGFSLPTVPSLPLFPPLTHYLHRVWHNFFPVPPPARSVSTVKLGLCRRRLPSLFPLI